MFKKGDLVHVPSQTRIEKFADAEEAALQVTSWQTFKQPKKLLVTESSPKYGYIGVFFEDATWYVKEQDVYLLEDE